MSFPGIGSSLCGIFVVQDGCTKTDLVTSSKGSGNSSTPSGTLQPSELV